jgi:hypothetical protein
MGSGGLVSNFSIAARFPLSCPEMFGYGPQLSSGKAGQAAANTHQPGPTLELVLCL